MPRTILTIAGKADLLSAWKDSELFMGFGAGDEDWFTSRVQEETFDGENEIDLGFPLIAEVVVKSQDEETIYTEDDDYTVNLITGIVTRVAEGSIPALAIVKVSFNTSAPAIVAGDVGLIEPIAYKKITGKSFAELDDEGTVIVDTGTFALVEGRRENLYVTVTLTPDELEGETIREIGIFRGLERAEGVDVDQALLLPADVDDPGILVALKRRSPQVRDGITENKYQRVLSL